MSPRGTRPEDSLKVKPRNIMPPSCQSSGHAAEQMLAPPAGRGDLGTVSEGSSLAAPPPASPHPHPTPRLYVPERQYSVIISVISALASDAGEILIERVALVK
ncbi:unnamed protein product [Merluccius merluccius]